MRPRKGEYKKCVSCGSLRYFTQGHIKDGRKFCAMECYKDYNRNNLLDGMDEVLDRIANVANRRLEIKRHIRAYDVLYPECDFTLQE